MIKRKWAILLLVLALLGLFDSLYLTVKTISKQPVACSVISGCEEVLSSKYSHVGPIPVSALGVAYYLAVLVLAAHYLQSPGRKAAHLVKILVPIGIVASAVFVGLQLFVIKSICIYCFASAIISTLIFFVGWYGLNPPPSDETTIKL